MFNLCVIAIQEGNYEFAYMRYKNTVILLEEKFAKPMLQNQLVNTLKKNKTNINYKRPNPAKHLLGLLI